MPPPPAHASLGALSWTALHAGAGGAARAPSRACVLLETKQAGLDCHRAAPCRPKEQGKC